MYLSQFSTKEGHFGTFLSNTKPTPPIPNEPSSLISHFPLFSHFSLIFPPRSPSISLSRNSGSKLLVRRRGGSLQATNIIFSKDLSHLIDLSFLYKSRYFSLSSLIFPAFCLSIDSFPYCKSLVDLGLGVIDLLRFEFLGCLSD